jgi:hypothetical protein
MTWRGVGLTRPPTAPPVRDVPLIELCSANMLTLTRKPMSTRDAVHRARLCYAPRQIARRHDSTLSAFGIDTEDRRDILAYAAASRQRSELESQNMTGLPETCRSQAPIHTVTNISR